MLSGRHSEISLRLYRAGALMKIPSHETRKNPKKKRVVFFAR